MPNEPSSIDLYKVLTEQYTLEELRTLCFQLGVDYEDLGGEGRSGKARELILWLQLRGRFGRLEAILQETERVRREEEGASLKRQLTKFKRNLLTIEERKADYIDLRNVPPDLAQSEKRIQEEIAKIEARLAELES